MFKNTSTLKMRIDASTSASRKMWILLLLLFKKVGLEYFTSHVLNIFHNVPIYWDTLVVNRCNCFSRSGHKNESVAGIIGQVKFQNFLVLTYLHLYLKRDQPILIPSPKCDRNEPQLSVKTFTHARIKSTCKKAAWKPVGCPSTTYAFIYYNTTCQVTTRQTNSLDVCLQ